MIHEKFLCAYDSETWPIWPGLSAPKMVCGQFAGGGKLDVRLPSDALAILERLLGEPKIAIVGHNIAYDVAVACAADPSMIPLWFQAYRDDRIVDTKIRQMLLDLRDGNLGFEAVSGRRINYSLADLVRQYFGVDISESKKDPNSWRLRYCELDGVPIEQWPPEALAYAKDDAAWTLKVCQAQGGKITNEHHQARADFALQLASCWGMRTDKAAIDALEAELRGEIGAVDEMMKLDGLMRPNGKVDKKALQARVAEAYSSSPPTTDKGNVKTDSETLLASGDALLVQVGKANKPKHHLRNTIKALREGEKYPVNPSFWVLKKTGRISATKPNVTNFPKEGGYRECFRPRDGYVYAVADYSQIELVALAHLCETFFGWSAMADAIRAGLDLHIVLGSELLGIDYATVLSSYEAGDKEAKRARDTAKMGNYGLAGGMSANTFVDYAAGFGMILELSEAERVREAWLKTWPEMRQYFTYIKGLFRPGQDKCVVTQLHSGRVRAGCFFTEACNTGFQGLTADGALDAAFHLQRECYTVPKSPLYGSRLVAFVHDEFVLETPEEGAHEAAMRLSKVAEVVMGRWIRNLPIEAVPVLTRKWSKKAVQVFDDRQRLAPWEG
jgi:hypothetical protein